MPSSGAPGSGTAALAYVSILVFQTFDRMIFGRLSFPGARWYLATVWGPQMVRDEKKFGKHCFRGFEQLCSSASYDCTKYEPPQCLCGLQRVLKFCIQAEKDSLRKHMQVVVILPFWL